MLRGPEQTEMEIANEVRSKRLAKKQETCFFMFKLFQAIIIVKSYIHPSNSKIFIKMLL